MTSKPNQSSQSQLDTSLSIKQLVNIRAEAIRIVEFSNKAIALNQFSGNAFIDKQGLIQQAQNEECANIHSSVDKILDCMGVELVGDESIQFGDLAEVNGHIHSDSGNYVTSLPNNEIMSIKTGEIVDGKHVARFLGLV